MCTFVNLWVCVCRGWGLCWGGGACGHEGVRGLDVAAVTDSGTDGDVHLINWGNTLLLNFHFQNTWFKRVFFSDKAWQIRFLSEGNTQRRCHHPPVTPTQLRVGVCSIQGSILRRRVLSSLLLQEVGRRTHYHRCRGKWNRHVGECSPLHMKDSTLMTVGGNSQNACRSCVGRSKSR